MADDRYRREYPQHNRAEDQSQQQHYHRTSGEQSRHGPEPPRSTMAASVTLPSIHDPRGGGYSAQPPPAGRGYPSDPRYASPNAVNGYPPPPGGHQGHPSGYLPPMPPQSDPRGAPYPPPDQRGGYYDDRRPHQYAEYPPEAYYYRGQPPPNGYPRDYRGPPPGAYPEYAQGAPPQMAQAAPRQRTSIACRYCRKRKIRCSGYQSAPGGKCQNCARMNQECIFQPVSSSSSTAFIPVSAVPGGVPPGTQLFGSYGEPLPPNPGPSGHHYPPHAGPSHAGPSHAGGPPPPPPGYYPAPGQSPTEPYASYDRRSEDGSQSATKRSRDPAERDDEWRRPPPRGTAEEESRRRSPAEFSSKSSPGGMSYPYRGAAQSPRAAAQAPAGRPAPGPSPSGQNGSSGTSTPSQQAASTASQSQQAPTSVMSLSNLVDKSDIDKTMIDRLNKPPYPGHGKKPSR